MPSSNRHVNNAIAMWKKDTSEEWGEKITRARNHDMLWKRGGGLHPGNPNNEVAQARPT